MDKYKWIEKIGLPSVLVIMMMSGFTFIYRDMRADASKREIDWSTREERYINRIDGFQEALDKFGNTLQKIEFIMDAKE